MADHYHAHSPHGRMTQEQRMQDPFYHQMRDRMTFPSFINNNGGDPHLFRSPRRNFPSHGFDDGFSRGGFKVEDHPSPMFNRRESGHVESIPIKVIHEKSPSSSNTRPGSATDHSPSEFSQHKHHPFTGGRKTTEIPLPFSATQEAPQGSPRLERAHSEPPKSFHQRMSTLHPQPSPIPEKGDEESQHPITTSASAPSVPGETAPPAAASPPVQTSSGDKTQSSTPSAPPPPSSNQQHPQVRHIPIVVEGRDVPVFNRKFSDQSNSTRPKVEPPHVNVTSNKTTNKAAAPQMEPTTPQGPPPGPIPMGCSADHLKPVEPSSPLPLPEGPIALPCSPNLIHNRKNKEGKSDKTADAPDGNSALEKETPKEQANKAGEQKQQQAEPETKDPALEKVKAIQVNLAEITPRIDEFKGSKKDKEYLYLDEMLTRHLISLDSIDSGGKEEIRKIRKESINSVNRCLSLLESKAVPS